MPFLTLLQIFVGNWLGETMFFCFFFFTYYLISIHVFPILNPPSKKTYLKIHMVHRVKALKNWCFLIVLDKTLECPLDSKKIKSVNPKGNQPWIFTGRTDVEAPILWPPDAKSRLTGKDPDAGKDGGKEEKGATVDEMVGWHHWLNGHDFEQTLGDGEG